MRLSALLLSKIRRYKIGKFIDSVKVHVRSGDGADGAAKFGGIGGHGGDVVLEATTKDTLDAFYRRWRKISTIAAVSGQKSQQKRIYGHNGEKKILTVPVGVAAYKFQKTGGGVLIGELNEEGQQLVVAKGGDGGGPDNDFVGQKGELVPVQLDLKLIADIGLVGFPNAGKSTLLKAISNAKPKVAAYPFTTVLPEVGIIQYKDKTKLSMADLPGLLEGAHKNHGLGHSFLRHIERTKLLLLVADINGFKLSPQHPHRDCLETIILLNRELELYDETLFSKPAFLIINKMDSPGSQEKLEEVLDDISNLEEVVAELPEDIRPKNVIKFEKVFAISASQGAGAVVELKKELKEMMNVITPEENYEDYSEKTMQ